MYKFSKFSVASHNRSISHSHCTLVCVRVCGRGWWWHSLCSTFLPAVAPPSPRPQSPHCILCMLVNEQEQAWRDAAGLRDYLQRVHCRFPLYTGQSPVTSAGRLGNAPQLCILERARRRWVLVSVAVLVPMGGDQCCEGSSDKKQCPYSRVGGWASLPIWQESESS